MIVAYVAGGVLEGCCQMIVIASFPLLTAITLEGQKGTLISASEKNDDQYQQSTFLRVQYIFS